MSKLSENSRKVFDFVKAVDGQTQVTAADIAEATGLNVKQVTGCVNSAFQKKGLMTRIPAQVQDAETGMYKDVKYITLTDAGRAFDPDAVEPEKTAE